MIPYLSRTCELISVTGTPAEIPEIPKATRNNNYVDYRLANIKVNANSTSITQVDVEDTRAGDECGFITALIQQPGHEVQKHLSQRRLYGNRRFGKKAQSEV